MSIESTNQAKPVLVSMGIFAWNEERAIAALLESLYKQSLFAELAARGQAAEIVCVLNGCTDQTEAVARTTAGRLGIGLGASHNVSFRVANLSERGKNNAWNEYVHRLSAQDAQALFLMDADILIHQPGTLSNMLRTLETYADAQIAVDRPLKDIALKRRKSLNQRLSLASSQITQAAEAQLCAQLYVIRAAVARNLYLPKDLAACEDGFIKAVVCTDACSHEVWASRIRVAEGAEHIFEAYTSLAAVLRNQQRQVLGQTIVHILVDKWLRDLPAVQRRELAQTIRQKEQADAFWLKRLIAEHLQEVRHCWRLYPSLLGQRFAQARRLTGARRLACYPAALAASAILLLSSWRAYRLLKSGCTDYWPKAQRLGLRSNEQEEAAALQVTRA